MDTPLTNHDIARSLRITDDYFVKYSDLSNYESLDQLFGSKPCLLILIEETKQSGHWVSMVRTGPMSYLYNNSYGLKPDADLTIIGALRNRILGNTRNSIQTLKQGATIGYNSVRMQGARSETCGRYSIIFIHSIMGGMDMQQYQSYMLEMKKKYGSYDKATVALTSEGVGVAE